MTKKVENFVKSYLKKDLPEIKPGNLVRVYQKIPFFAKATAGKKEEEKIQVFEGIVIARKHGKGINSTIIVRKVLSGVGVERIFPLHSPTIEKIEVLEKGKVRRAKLYYLRKKQS
ncbi:50S ribosomal protein L19 [bacterium (Candidatus Gribaldobacteria) CG07_land_8_20_14_0_80_33_18]|uniref:50S ribosomal protein L19 n=1 Tax=bacterium (Candidatus Gribaldobacteria) CG07_land_8_20_14_0_80_33_18 TaxID=2014272 RepID=A0A2M6Z4H3_9BACT|nr:MAG: 50S ribosomal protein L19 [bacterium (Candidatus Gribaldobacteria) CG10_big_fil_rev_8_21_14_0_10_33_41]PIU47235.1 MAG: 50S ribosomal protein L19 [bacterium (Candidatus Gribaldobacteria) CG07_land_8_20_14_0_80_33_18]PJA01081.1 MAG: 50S ribosomal protein L19 [bacterium (Candidatus Gribaldobacteria) CG_4_10_14_0_2_um_filter_33_15]PJB08746.1 MAG: 50S ribosomal protein L19 [bacterium (Candidatus Gribaldobacteria) CG_4_9_14_3_um_filter_33_9]